MRLGLADPFADEDDDDEDDDDDDLEEDGEFTTPLDNVDELVFFADAFTGMQRGCACRGLSCRSMYGCVLAGRTP
jgi:hypothetical protein